MAQRLRALASLKVEVLGARGLPGALSCSFVGHCCDPRGLGGRCNNDNHDKRNGTSSSNSIAITVTVTAIVREIVRVGVRVIVVVKEIVIAKVIVIVIVLVIDNEKVVNAFPA